ncbi:MAG: hypothetical protein H7Z41_11520 [Cytophagales bacterium]|nr:hypothetical protein [Armatimonadota bacterium]
MRMGFSGVIGGSVVVGIVSFVALWLLFARVKDGMDGIRIVYISLFSAALSLLVGGIGGVLYWFLNRRS